MITNKIKVVQLKMIEARFWPKMKFETIFLRFFGRFSIRKGRFRRRAEGGFGGNSARPTNFGRNLFEFFRTHTASWEMKSLGVSIDDLLK